MKFHERPFVLREIKLELTYRCTLACVHCSSDATPGNVTEMSTADCARILSEAASLGANELAFSGGEPFLWEGLDDTVGQAAGLGFDVSIYTSGNAPSFGGRIAPTVRRGVKRLIFSVFGSDHTSHERVTRHSGSFEGTLAAIRSARDAGARCEIHFVPLRENYHLLPAIANLARHVGTERVSLLRFVPQGRGALLSRSALTRMDNMRLKRSVELLRKDGFDIRTGSPYNFLMLSKEPKCCSGIDRLIVAPDLKFYPCDAFKQVAATEIAGTAEYSTLADASLADCWSKSPYLEAVRTYLTTPFGEPCSHCGLLEMCLSGCLAQKVIAFRDLNKHPDPMCLVKRTGGLHGS